MAFATINGKDVVSATLSVPRTGVWRLDAVLDVLPPATIGAALTLTIGEGKAQATWTAQAFRLADNFGRLELRAVGGAGGLAHQLPGQSYREAPARAVLTDLLGAVGESLAPSSTAALLDTVLPRWSRQEGPASAQLAQLVAELGATWRMLPTGKVWVGVEAWPAAATFALDVMSKSPADGRTVLGAIEGHRLLPGTTFQGQRVAYVEHQILPDSLRTSVWFETL